tara:strand:- start:488 stop:1072 length:585 start_codon:yes stop_codon:yes gene_type:complete
MHNNKLFEGLEIGDLKRLLRNELHIDQFKSKMGDDADVIVLSFKIKDKEPALDLVDFVEKGYDWVLDGDISSGEKADGDYLVFVEMPRDRDAPDRIMRLIADTNNLTALKMEDWHWKYHKELKDYDMTEERLAAVIPLTVEAYNTKFGIESEEAVQEDIHTELDHLRAVAGVTVTTTAPKNDFTESLRIAAGIK